MGRAVAVGAGAWTLLALLVGCAGPALPGEGMPTSVATVPRSPTPVSVLTGTPVLTVTPPRSSTPPTTRTPYPTRTPTSTPLPTLEPGELAAFVLQMLETNGGCELPCWWGITPGETRWEDMLAYFRQREVNVVGGHLDVSYPEQDGYRLPILSVEFQQEEDVVQSVRIRQERFGKFMADRFEQIGRRYALDQVLTRFGVPSEVYLTLYVGSPCIGAGIVPAYQMWIVYQHLGIAILYNGYLVNDLGGWLFCPVFYRTGMFGETSVAEILLQAPSSDAPIVSVEPGDDPFVIAGTLTELTGMSLEAFYEAFSQPTPRTCAFVADPTPGDGTLTRPTGSLLGSPEDEDAFLATMLATNGGCELPCWWGITPGVTRVEDARQWFLSYGRRIVSESHYVVLWQTDEPTRYFNGVAHIISPFGQHGQYPFDYVVEHTLYEQGSGTVQLLGVIGHALGGDTAYTPGWSPPQYFARDWQRYTLDQILSRFGPPSQVLLHYWPYSGALYSLGVLYEEQGILVVYMGPVQGEGLNPYLETRGDALICPTGSRVTDIGIWLRSPEMDMSLADIFTDWRAARGYYTLPFATDQPDPILEEITGMDLETFYLTYLDPDTQTCLEAPVELGDLFP